MTNIRQILVAGITMAMFLQKTKLYRDKQKQNNLLTTKSNFTKLGEDTLNKHIWKCYVPTSILGKNREISTIEATKLLENVKHIDDIHLMCHYEDMPLKKLEEIFMTVIFSDYGNDGITEQLQNALYIKSIMKSAAKNGSIDALNQEETFKKALKKDEKLTDFIDRTGKHPLVLFLGVNTRTLKSFGGNQNAKK